MGIKLKRLRYGRFEKAISLDELSANVGINKSHLFRVEKGDKMLSYPKLIDMLKFFNVSLEWFLNGDVADIDKATIPAFQEIESVEFLGNIVSDKIEKLSTLNVSNTCVALRSPNAPTLVFKKPTNYDTDNRLISFRFSTLAKMAYHFNVSIEWLLYGDSGLIEKGQVPQWVTTRNSVCTC
jgi:transcriptional regulator with XRE-family HTH domain